MMLKTAFKGTIVVVEGITDRRLYGKFFDNDNVDVVIAYSKDNVRNAVKEVYAERGCKSVIGIIDADLDYLFGKKREPPLFLTDTRDNETLMLKSDAMSDVMHEYADEERLERFTNEFGDIRSVVLDSCYPVGALMYVSFSQGLDLSFKDLDFTSFIDRRTLRCNIRELVNEVTNNTMSRSSNPKRVLLSLENELHNERDPWTVCRGHDAMEVLAFGFRMIFGSNNSRYIKSGELSGGFRLAFDKDDLAGTDLYRKTSEWCRDKGLKLWSF